MKRTFTVILLSLYAWLPTASSQNQPGAYREQHRPQIHFSPPANWMNDPNGMVFFEGEYHLFYQYYPDSNVWGPMHWGHAVSKDLVQWEHLPIALYPDSLGYIFSGSVVVDRNNSSGFGKDGKAPLIAIYTYHNMAGEKAGRTDFQYQGIAYSNDRGRTWTKYAGNPVIPNKDAIRDFRDPKVIFDARSQRWIMVFAAYDHVKFWASKDLKNWTHLSDFGKEWGNHGGVWECPDLFPMLVDGSEPLRWVLLVSINPGAPNGGSGTQYFVGDFDGKTFLPDHTFLAASRNGNAVWLDHGRDNYAGVTWSDVLAKDGRRLFLGWMSNWDYAQVVPTTVWRSAMTLPRALSLRQTGEGYRLFSQPVRELEKLRGASQVLRSQSVAETLPLTLPTPRSEGLLEVMLEFDPGDAAEANFGVEFSNAKGESYRIGYDARNKQFYSDRTKAGDAAFSEKFAEGIHKAPRVATDRPVRFHLFLDVASSELFADNGATVMTDVFFPATPFDRVSLYSENGAVRLTTGKVYALKPVWGR